MKITISGDIGSGKSTVGERLANMFDCELIDCGQLYRNYAKDKGVDVLVQNLSNDNSIDKKIDGLLEDMNESSVDRVFVSRTAWHFVPSALHIYLSVNPVLAAERILSRQSNNETHDSIDEIIEYNKKRIDTEDKRYEEMYGITRTQQLLDADIIICIGSNNIDSVVNTLGMLIRQDTRHILVTDPKSVVPTQVIRDISISRVEDYREEIKGTLVKLNTTLDFVNGLPYVYDGHHRIAAACLNDVCFIYTNQFGICDKEALLLTSSQYHDWEDLTKTDMSPAIRALKEQ